MATMPNDNRRPVRIACFGIGGTFFRERLAHGVQSYVRQHPGWYVRFFPGDPVGVAAATAWQPHGAIAHLDQRPIAMALAGWSTPLINSSRSFPELPHPYVGVDNRAVGRLAGNHLLDAGYRRFAFVGRVGFANSRQRQEGFLEVARIADPQVAIWDGPVPIPGGGVEPEDRAFGDWLTALPDRCGIMVDHEPLAALVFDHARDRDLAVPDRLAIISGLAEEMAGDAALSAVRLEIERWGYRAAEVLGDWLLHDRQPADETLLQPEGIEVRGSTSPVAFSDPLIRQAMIFIRDHADRAIQVLDVAKALNTSRRALERRFASEVGRSILAEIHRAHVEHAKILLLDHDLPLKVVARRCGLASEAHLRRLFQKTAGESPGSWRHRFKSRNPGQ